MDDHAQITQTVSCERTRFDSWPRGRVLERRDLGSFACEMVLGDEERIHLPSLVVAKSLAEGEKEQGQEREQEEGLVRAGVLEMYSVRLLGLVFDFALT